MANVSGSSLKAGPVGVVMNTKRRRRREAIDLRRTPQLKRHSSTPLMSQDNRLWIFYMSSIWKPINPSPLERRPVFPHSALQASYSMINETSTMLRWKTLLKYAALDERHRRLNYPLIEYDFICTVVNLQVNFMLLFKAHNLVLQSLNH